MCFEWPLSFMFDVATMESSIFFYIVKKMIAN